MGDRTQVKKLILRYCLFLIGLFFASLGVAFSIKAGLGTSPVSSVPFSVSLLGEKFQISWWFKVGGWLNVLSVIQILVQIAILRKKCKWLEIIIQTVLAFVYGYLTNFSCWIIKGLTLTNYVQQLFCMFASCFILAFGIWLQFKGGVAMLPGEAMNRAISEATGKKYENIKIFFDILYIVISAILCLIFFGRLKGVREGSIIAAIFIGLIIKFYNWIWQKIFKNQEKKKEQTEE